MNRTGKLAIALLLGTGTLLSSGCTETQKSAGIGTAAGAALGGIIGHQSGKGGQGALIGGAVGALGGAAIGKAKEAKKTSKENDALREENEALRLQAENERLRNELQK